MCPSLFSAQSWILVWLPTAWDGQCRDWACRVRVHRRPEGVAVLFFWCPNVQYDPAFRLVLRSLFANNLYLYYSLV
jgi:hypothetical protein